jgi:hypothetical protein
MFYTGLRGKGWVMRRLEEELRTKSRRKNGGDGAGYRVLAGKFKIARHGSPAA